MLIRITATDAEMSKGGTLKAFEHFKNTVTLLYGEGFTFLQKENVFEASKRRDVFQVDEIRSEKLLNLIGTIPLSAFNAKRFVCEYIILKEGEKVPLEIRMINLLSYLTRHENVSLEHLLSIDGQSVLGKRNYGARVYLQLCSTFASLGFDTSQYPLFNQETRVRKISKIKNPNQK